MTAPNTAPIYSKAADCQWITPCTVANNTPDLTSGTSYLVFTADSTNGGFVRELRCKALPGNNTAATVMRVWMNNGSTLGTASNTILIGEIGIPATTAAAAGPQADFVYPIGFALPAGYKIYVTFGTAPGGSGAFGVAALGGKY